VVQSLMVAGVLGFAVASRFALALAAFWLVTMASGPRMPLEQAWMNQNLDAQVRATVFSMKGQVQALAAIAGGPVLGAIATAYTTRPALIASALALSPALLLYARAARYGRPLAAAGGPEAALTEPQDRDMHGQSSTHV
jgi:DHA3 family tetracycline resistance protein-like MFS transporter